MNVTAVNVTAVNVTTGGGGRAVRRRLDKAAAVASLGLVHGGEAEAPLLRRELGVLRQAHQPLKIVRLLEAVLA